MVARGDDANFVVQNIGTGVALNVAYRFYNLDSPERDRRDKSYLVLRPTGPKDQHAGTDERINVHW
jgi:hypothetical protein